MSSKRVGPLGTVTVASLASSKVAVYSKGTVDVYQNVTTANQPDSWLLLGSTTNGQAIHSITAASDIRIDAGSAEVLYELGVDARVTDRAASQIQGTPGVLNATGALTALMISSGIVTSTTGAAVVATVPTGTVMEASLLDMQIGDSYDWSAINTGGNAFTVTAAASGHTLVGVGAVATVTSAPWRTRKTAAATFVSYRLG